MRKEKSKNEGPIAESYKNYQLVNEGDFVMIHMDLLTGWVDISKYEGVTSSDYRVFILLDEDTMIRIITCISFRCATQIAYSTTWDKEFLYGKMASSCR